MADTLTSAVVKTVLPTFGGFQGSRIVMGCSVAATGVTKRLFAH